MNLNILISTIDERINQVPSVLLPQQSGVSYIVVHQFTSAEAPLIPNELQRPDVNVSQIRGQGVTFARNRSLQLADGDIALFADDDVTYRSEYFDTVREVMQAHPDLAVAKFKVATPAGDPEYKDYPDTEYYLLKSENTGTIQLAIRPDLVRKHHIQFDTRFGAGNSRLIGGDEQIFIHDCLAAGLVARYFPRYIVEHPYVSTAKTIGPYDARRVRVAGGLDARLNGWIAVPKAIAGAVRYCPDILRNGSNPFSYCGARISGAFHVLTTKPSNASLS